MAERQRIIIGGGGHSKVLVGLLRNAKLPLLGIVTSSKELVGTSLGDCPVLGLEGDYALDAASITLVNGVGNVASGKGSGIAPRAMLYDRYTAAGFTFLPCISVDAMVQPFATINAGAQIMAGAIVQPYAQIGENVIINSGASIDHDSIIGKHSHVAPGAVLCGKVRVGEATHIGAGAVILQDVSIGSNVVIGAGCVIDRDIEDGAVIRR